jgi:hypothetical protein
MTGNKYPSIRFRLDAALLRRLRRVAAAAGEFRAGEPNASAGLRLAVARGLPSLEAELLHNATHNEGDTHDEDST